MSIAKRREAHANGDVIGPRRRFFGAPSSSRQGTAKENEPDVDEPQSLMARAEDDIRDVPLQELFELTAAALLDYNSVFPYPAVLDIGYQRDLAEIVEEVFFLQDSFESMHSYDCKDAILLPFRMLKDLFDLNLQECRFIDCLGYGCAAALYASSFGVQYIKSIEFSKKGFEIGKKIASEVVNYRRESSHYAAGTEVVITEGCMLDYFEFDANVAYLDCSLLDGDASLLDEGIMLSLFFGLVRRMLPGSFLIVLTVNTPLNTASCREMGYPFIDCVHAADTTVVKATGTRDLYPMKLWLLKTTTNLL